jgi:hypothetical protein
LAFALSEIGLSAIEQGGLLEFLSSPSVTLEIPQLKEYCVPLSRLSVDGFQSSIDRFEVETEIEGENEEEEDSELKEIFSKVEKEMTVQVPNRCLLEALAFERTQRASRNRLSQTDSPSASTDSELGPEEHEDEIPFFTVPIEASTEKGVPREFPYLERMKQIPWLTVCIRMLSFLLDSYCPLKTTQTFEDAAKGDPSFISLIPENGFVQVSALPEGPRQSESEKRQTEKKRSKEEEDDWPDFSRMGAMLQSRKCGGEMLPDFDDEDLSHEEVRAHTLDFARGLWNKKALRGIEERRMGLLMETDSDFSHGAGKTLSRLLKAF